MTPLRLFLILSWVLITGLTLYIMVQQGFNWPAVLLADLFSTTWRAQFNADFILHILLFCSWIYWREDSKLTGGIYAFLAIFGAVFSFVYLLIATYKAKGDMRTLLLGSHA